MVKQSLQAVGRLAGSSSWPWNINAPTSLFLDAAARALVKIGGTIQQYSNNRTEAVMFRRLPLCVLVLYLSPLALALALALRVQAPCV